MADPKYASQLQSEQIDQNGAPLFPTNTAFYTAGSVSDLVVKVGAGRLFKIIVTVAGTAADALYDNASAGSGSLIFSTKAAPALADIYDFGTQGVPFVNGLTIKGIAASSGITVVYA
jgi:hypothetical protein